MSSSISNWHRKDLVAIEDLTRKEVETVLELATSFKATLGRSQKSYPLYGEKPLSISSWNLVLEQELLLK